MRLLVPEADTGLELTPSLTVSQLTRSIAGALRTDPLLADCRVEGEISNCTRAASGHLYFTLRDETAVVCCVMWRTDAARLRFEPKNGAQVLVRGRVDVYAPRGQYQLVVQQLAPVGEGDLFAALARLRALLASEGLLAPERKRPLPVFPRRVVVVTSPSGAALRDIVSTLRAAGSPPEIIISPAQVQGAGAAESLCAALARASRLEHVDCLILARGGGSLEDLWSFNSETLARAICIHPSPVISAVGHETDFSIADMVADFRAPTPTSAAETICRLCEEPLRRLRLASQRASRAMMMQLRHARLRLQSSSSRPVMLDPQRLTARAGQRLDDSAARASAAVEVRVKDARHRLELAAGRAASSSPLGLLGRGYAHVTHAESGQPLKSIRQMLLGESLRVRLVDGAIQAVATEIIQEGNEDAAQVR